MDWHVWCNADKCLGVKTKTNRLLFKSLWANWQNFHKTQKFRPVSESSRVKWNFLINKKQQWLYSVKLCNSWGYILSLVKQNPRTTVNVNIHMCGFFVFFLNFHLDFTMNLKLLQIIWRDFCLSPDQNGSNIVSPWDWRGQLSQGYQPSIKQEKITVRHFLFYVSICY